MKYRWLLIAIVALFVTGCEANVHDDPNRMTQQIVTDTLTPLTPNATGSPAPQPTAQSQSDLMARLYQVKAEQDAIEVELDNLEADYRIGKVDDVAFQTKKAELKALDKALDEEEDQLEDVLEEQIPAPTLPSGSADQLREQLRTLEREEEQNELEQDQLEDRYRSGEIDRDTFLERQAELLQREDELERYEDAIEDIID